MISSRPPSKCTGHEKMEGQREGGLEAGEEGAEKAEGRVIVKEQDGWRAKNR